MSTLAIRAENISKRYRIGANVLAQRSLYDTVGAKLRGWREQFSKPRLKPPVLVDRVRLLPFHLNVNLFPTQFKIELSNDGISWETVAHETSYAPAKEVWYECSFAPRRTRFVRFRGESRPFPFFYGQRFLVQIAAFQVLNTSESQKPVPVLSSRSSTSFSVDYSSAKALEESPETCWSSAQRQDAHEEFLEVDLCAQEEQSQEDAIWALHGVSFEVKQGEMVGVVGRNGSGKSTLLKILARVTAPTEGCVEVFGRLGCLLELGSGFNPELTGRDNVYLNGAILGMSKAAIDERFEEIHEFSEIGKFIDTPLKHYSSGMGMRLAFAVASYMDHQILLLDEVLAVGDLKFATKCRARMEEIIRKGRTVILVNHDVNTIQSLCQSALLLDGGQLVDAGPAPDVVKSYLRLLGIAG